MSIEKMALATLSGPVGMIDIVIQSFVINREFHPENAVSHMRGMKSLVSFDLENPYSPLLETAKKLAGDLDISPEYRDFDGMSMTAENSKDYLETLAARLMALRDERARLELAAADDQSIIDTLSHIRNVATDLDYILNMKCIKFRFGRIPRNIYYEAHQRIASRADVFFVHTSIEEDYVYGMYFALPSAQEPVDALFASLKFERIWISEKVHGTSDEAMAVLRDEILDAKRRTGELSDKIEALKQSEKLRLLEHYSYIRFMNDSFSLRSFAGRSAESFYIVGWIPQSAAGELAHAMEAEAGFSCIISTPKEIPGLTPPIKQKHPAILKIFTPFIEMYGLPSYWEIDPTFFMTVTYTILFGAMFGDVGQGIALFFVGLIMHKVRDMWLGKILACTGVSATAFGFVYGSVFGFEDILPGFHVMEGSNVLTVLIISGGVGAVLICVCMVINIINGVRQRDPGKALFSANGLAGLVLYVSVLAAGVLLVVTGISLFTVPYICFLIALPLLLIMCNEPLTKLIRGKKDWKPDSIGSFIIEGFFELLETILSYISNTISFLRVGAFAIIHSGMMMVVFLLAETGAGYSPAVLIIGNILVMALETMLVCIQLLRLEFYEMFGRFYDSGGVKFSPRIIDYSK